MTGVQNEVCDLLTALTTLVEKSTAKTRIGVCLTLGHIRGQHEFCPTKTGILFLEYSRMFQNYPMLSVTHVSCRPGSEQDNSAPSVLLLLESQVVLPAWLIGRIIQHLRCNYSVFKETGEVRIQGLEIRSEPNENESRIPMSLLTREVASLDLEKQVEKCLKYHRITFVGDLLGFDPDTLRVKGKFSSETASDVCSAFLWQTGRNLGDPVDRQTFAEFKRARKALL